MHCSHIAWFVEADRYTRNLKYQNVNYGNCFKWKMEDGDALDPGNENKELEDCIRLVWRYRRWRREWVNKRHWKWSARKGNEQLKNFLFGFHFAPFEFGKDYEERHGMRLSIVLQCSLCSTALQIVCCLFMKSTHI